MIAPYWADADIRDFGNISYRILNESEPISNLQQIISSTFAISNFQPKEVFVATYYQVPAYEDMDRDPNQYQYFLTDPGIVSGNTSINVCMCICVCVFMHISAHIMYS